MRALLADSSQEAGSPGCQALPVLPFLPYPRPNQPFRTKGAQILFWCPHWPPPTGFLGQQARQIRKSLVCSQLTESAGGQVATQDWAPGVVVDSRTAQNLVGLDSGLGTHLHTDSLWLLQPEAGLEGRAVSWVPGPILPDPDAASSEPITLVSPISPHL